MEAEHKRRQQMKEGTERANVLHYLIPSRLTAILGGKKKKNASRNKHMKASVASKQEQKIIKTHCLLLQCIVYRPSVNGCLVSGVDSGVMSSKIITN